MSQINSENCHQPQRKNPFCIDALLAKQEDLSCSISPLSRHSDSLSSPCSSQDSGPISPGSEDFQQQQHQSISSTIHKKYPDFVQQHHHPQSHQQHMLNNANLLQYSSTLQPNFELQHNSSTNSNVHKVPFPIGLNHHNQQIQQIQLEWLARSGMFYPRLPDLSGKSLVFSF